MSNSEFWDMGLVWVWAAHLLMYRILFLFCWRINVKCLALKLAGFGFSVRLENIG